jgi:tRNA threonylcarbamoyladenosine biosynthesis protein TsaE
MSEQRQRAAQPPNVLDCVSHSPTQTARIGQRLGELLRAGDTVLLLGEFGAGKTHFAKGVALGLGSEDLVNSPSFVLVNEYRAGPQHRHMRIYHVDLYRLEDPREVGGIGLEELTAGDGVCMVEWAERGAGWLPGDHLEVRLGYLSDTKRTLRFTPRGARYEVLVGELKRSAFG